MGLVNPVCKFQGRRICQRGPTPKLSGAEVLTIEIIGVSGLAGDLVRRLGLAGAFRASLLCMAAAIGLLATAPGAPLWAYLSATLFGSAYIMVTGIVLGGSRRGLPAHRLWDRSSGHP